MTTQQMQQQTVEQPQFTMGLETYAWGPPGDHTIPDIIQEHPIDTTGANGAYVWLNFDGVLVQVTVGKDELEILVGDDANEGRWLHYVTPLVIDETDE